MTKTGFAERAYRLGACGEAVEFLAANEAQGFEWLVEHAKSEWRKWLCIRTSALRRGLQRIEMSRHAATAAAWATYAAAVQAAWETYDAATAAAWETYDAATAAAWATYAAAVQAAWETYDAAWTAAWATYDAAILSLLLSSRNLFV